MPKTVLAVLLIALTTAFACAPAGPATQPNDREWTLLTADYQWLETVRSSQKKPAATATRKERIELSLENLKKLEPTYNAFMDKLHEYHVRTADPRAASLLSREKIILGDEYLSVLSRYEKAIDLYREALDLQPGSVDAQQRIAMAGEKRFVAMTSFANVKTGMKEDAVQRLIGLPREDWIKQVVQNNRVYSVWIYPKADAGAAAIYFDNGVVYHTNWNAAAPPAASKQ
jgi:tetratricopeptide (TPR) repeat protein